MTSDAPLIVRGAREHNLKSISVTLPRNRLIVITGLSGSGKSSLAFDTLYAEGQRRYVESLSAYARQFLERLEKPDVDAIEGLSPAIAIEQRSAGSNPRSTVATQTEIYDYLRVLFARAGQPTCPTCKISISRQSAQEIVAHVLALPAEAPVMILAPVVRGRKGEYVEVFREVKRQGFVRVRVDGVLRDLDEPIALDKKRAHTIEIVVDRLTLDSDVKSRLTESIETALKVGKGLVVVSTSAQGSGLRVQGKNHQHRTPSPQPRTPNEFVFSELYACSQCGFSFEELSPRIFSFNSPYGACATCDGLGTRLEIDPELVVPDRRKSLREGAIEPWKRGGMHMIMYYNRLLREVARFYGFSLETPFQSLSRNVQRTLLYGSNETIWEGTFEGVIPNLERRFRHTESDYVKEEIAKYMSVLPCPTCQGARLKPESLAVLIEGRSIAQVVRDSVTSAQRWLSGVRWQTKQQQLIAEPLVKEIAKRLQFLIDVGLGYLTLDRTSASLSGGEAQRIRLATQVGSGLVGVLYILDEPSIGLHQRDNDKLLNTLERLRDLGNTLIVVEHDEATIRRADYLVDLGPGAGKHGGEIVASGSVDDVIQTPGSLTGQFLAGKRWIPLPNARRPWKGRPALVIKGASEHNLKQLDVAIPLGCFVSVTGVSGSGKSTLIDEILYRTLARQLYGAKERPGKHEQILGINHIDKVIVIDQSPIGRTPRSNPATYTGAFSPIRDLFSQTPAAKLRGFKPGRFSFNVKGGRCEACQGDGIKRIEMHFLPDVYVRCEVCKGKRFNEQTLQVTYKGSSIADVLSMTVEDALRLFEAIPAIAEKLRTIEAVGLGYLELGQSATTLSGGEAQRIKLAKELSRRATGRTLYLLDEPTTGLHFADVDRLLSVLHQLVDHGNTVVVIEHNLEVIKTSDYVIDLGPEGGEAGGRLVAWGTPEEIAQTPGSFTGEYLKPLLSGPRGTGSDPSRTPVSRTGSDPYARGPLATFRRHNTLLFILCVIGTMLTWGTVAAQEPSTEYVAIQGAFLQEEFETTIQLAQSFLVQELDAPERSRVRIWLALSLDRLGRANEALGELDRLKAQLPTDDPLIPEVLFWEGDISRRALLMVRAKLAFQQLLERYPEATWATQAQMGLGLVYLHQQAFEAALEIFHGLALRHVGMPVAVDARLFEGVCQLHLKQFAEALQIFEALEHQVQRPELLAQIAFYMGESFTGLGRYDEAVPMYERTVTVGASSTWAHLAQFGLGWAYYQTGRCEESLSAFDHYLNLTDAPGSLATGQAARTDYRTEGLFAQGSCLIQLGREQDALARFEEVLGRNPAHPLALESGLLVVDIYRRAERFDEAKALLHEFLRQPLEQAARAKIQIRLGAIALDQGNPTQAKTIFQLAHAIDDPAIHQAALSGLGDVAMFLGDLGQAQQYYEQAIRTSDALPAAAAIRYQLGRIHLQMGRFDHAVQVFQEFSRGHSTLADDATLALALTYLSQRQEVAARAVLETVRQQRPESQLAARAAYYLALLALSEENEELVRLLCQETLARAPRSEEAVDARLVLAELLVQETSEREGIEWLHEAYRSPGLMRRHRAKLANRIADLARSQRSYNDAIRWYNTTMELLPALGPEATYWIASCYEGKDDLKTAMEWYQRVKEPPWRVRAQLALAKLLEHEEREAEAQVIYETLAAESIPEAKAIQERLAGGEE